MAGNDRKKSNKIIPAEPVLQQGVIADLLPPVAQPEQLMMQDLVPDNAPLKSPWTRFKEWFKTPLDKLYEDLHKAEKKLEIAEWGLKSNPTQKSIEEISSQINEKVRDHKDQAAFLDKIAKLKSEQIQQENLLVQNKLLLERCKQENTRLDTQILGLETEAATFAGPDGESMLDSEQIETLERINSELEQCRQKRMANLSEITKVQSQIRKLTANKRITDEALLDLNAKNKEISDNLVKIRKLKTNVINSDLRKEQQRFKRIIDDLHLTIKTYKANRRWYDISKWSTNEKIARLWFAFIYAVLCGISINASINAMEIPLTLGLLGLTFPLSVFLGIIGAAITFSVNLSGFWDNVAKLFDEGDKSELKGKYSVIYGLFCTFFIGAASVLSTGLAISTIPGVFGISNYAILFPIFIIFGSTAYALQGLFTQQPRKWFKSFAEFGLKESIIRTAYRLWYGLVDDDKNDPYLDKPRDQWKPFPETSLGLVLHGLARVTLFLAFTAITTYASYIMAPYAAEATTTVIVNMLEFMTKGTISQLGITGLGFVAPTLAALFVVGSAFYNGALSGKLAVLATPFFEKVGASTLKALIEPIQKFNAQFPQLGHLPERRAIRAIIVYPVLLAVGAVNVLYKTLGFLAEKEISCWSEARDYARTQYYKKDTTFIWPHFIARLLYNHMPVWGAANALNNGALTAYSKLNGQMVSLTDLDKEKIIEVSSAVASGTTRSYGFYWLTKGDRDKNMQEQEDAIELEDIVDKKYECTHTYWWNKSSVPYADEVEKTGRQEYDAYFDSVAHRIRPVI